MTLFDIAYYISGMVCGWEYAKYEETEYILSIEGIAKFVFVGIWTMFILAPFKLIMNIFFGMPLP